MRAPRQESLGRARALKAHPRRFGVGQQQVLPGGSADKTSRPTGVWPGGAEGAHGGAEVRPGGTGVPRVRTVDIAELLGRRLNDIEAKNAPSAVHVAGPMSLPLPEPKVSVIGSRSAPPGGLDAARAMSRALSDAGAAIVSGLAAGVDAAAHREAIGAGGRTVAVIGTPLDRSYPAANAGLQAEIMRDHMVVSQFAAGSAVRRSNFVMRDRTMALLSDATVIAGATGSMSGTRHQGWEAIRLGRPLFIHRSVASGPSAAWATDMLEHGAVLVDGPEPVIDCIPPGMPMPGIFPAP